LGSSGGSFLIRDRQCDRPALPGPAHPSYHFTNTRALLADHQWVDALAGLGLGKGVLRQWFLGGSVWFNFNQHCELDIVQVFTF